MSYINRALDFGQLYRLRPWISLEPVKQSTSGKRRYQQKIVPTFDENNLGKIWSTNEIMTLIFDL